MRKEKLDLQFETGTQTLDILISKMQQLLSLIRQAKQEAGGLSFGGQGGAVGAGAVAGGGSGQGAVPIMGGAGNVSSFGAVSPSLMAALAMSVGSGTGRGGGYTPSIANPTAPIGANPFSPSMADLLYGTTTPGGGNINDINSWLGRADAYKQAVGVNYDAQMAMPGINAGIMGIYGRINADRQQEFAQHRANVGIMAAGAGIVAGDYMHAYTQSVMSGTQNQMGFGQALGAGIGLGAAGIALWAGAGAGVAGPIGLGVGALVGAGINMLQAPSMARLQATQAYAPYAAMSGGDAVGMANRAETMTAGLNEGFASQGGMMGRIGRFFHLYSGNDVVSTQDVGKVGGTLGTAYTDAGISVSDSQLDSNSRAFLNKYKGSAPELIGMYAKAVGASNATGGNIASLASAVGAGAAALYLRTDGRGAEADALINGWGGVQRAGYASAGALSDVRRTSFSSSYSDMIGGLQGGVNALSSEISAWEAIPGGANSNEAKAKRALRQEMLSQIAKESVAKVQGDAGIRNASVGVESTRASLYGGADSFAGVGQQAMASLNTEYNDLQGALGNPNLPFADRQAIKIQLRNIDQQRLSLPASVAGQEYRRRSIEGDYAASSAGVAYNQASLFGTNDQLGTAASGAYGTQQGIFSSAMQTFNNPNASVEDRLSAGMRANNASNAALQIQVGSRDTLLGRLSASAGLSEQAAGNVLSRASRLGTGSDVLAASAGVLRSLSGERDTIADQLAQGGLTVDQRNRLMGRQGEIAGKMFDVRQDSLDASYGKDDIQFATGYGNIQSRLRIGQYLPFAPARTMQDTVSLIGSAGSQVGALNSREASLRASGDLSPEREYEISRQRNGLREDIAAGVGQLSEGMENRLPALSGGRPGFFGRYNSFQLAAMNLSMMGSPIRGFGAVNGAQQAMQDGVFRDAGFSPGPYSRTEGMNNGRLEGVLDRLAGVLERLTSGGGGGSNMRQGEAAGAVNGLLGQSAKPRFGMSN